MCLINKLLRAFSHVSHFAFYNSHFMRLPGLPWPTHTPTLLTPFFPPVAEGVGGLSGGGFCLFICYSNFLNFQLLGALLWQPELAVPTRCRVVSVGVSPRPDNGATLCVVHAPDPNWQWEHTLLRALNALPSCLRVTLF